ncbi:MAG: TRAP transporter substrate-binding protein DctP [Chloroflexi bacterium]|nr:TRAP transporter substrate-binding protein DctP [Chloroflexota bacterium]
MAKKLVYSLLCLTLIAGLVLAGCAKPAPTPTPAPTVTVTASPSPAPSPTPLQAFRWRFAAYDPNLTSIQSRNHVEMVRAIFERSGGRLLIDVYPSGTLGYSGFTHHRVAGQGLLEIGETMSSAPTEAPVFGVFSQLMLFKDVPAAIKAWNAVKADLDKAAATFGSKILATTIRPLDVFHSTKKAFPTLDSFKGAKIRAWNDIISAWLTEVGAVPAVIPYAERYTALATGVVEGNFAGPVSQVDTKDYEIVKYTNMWPVDVPIYVTFVNLAAFNKLPADLQKILLEEAAKEEAKTIKELLDANVTAIDTLKSKGVTIVDVSPDEIAKAKAASEVVYKKWLATAGPDANAVMAKVLEAIK